MQINGCPAWVFALYKNFSKAALLTDARVTDLSTFSIEKAEQTAPLQIESGRLLSPFGAGSHNLVELLRTKPPHSSALATRQLHTGYCQIDLAQPVAYGQNLLCVGERTSGKLQVAISTAREFVQREDHVAVFALPNPAKRSAEIEALPRTFVYGATANSSDVAQYFVSYAALACALALQRENKHVLLVLDDILHHVLLEKSLFAYEKIVCCYTVDFVAHHQFSLRPFPFACREFVDQFSVS